MNELSIFYMLPLAMLMLMLVTRSYKKDISNAVSIVALLISGYLTPTSIDAAFSVLALATFLMQIRAIVNHNEDNLIKR